jgi:DNA repair exonuclease SbcCD ATPase subunit
VIVDFGSKVTGAIKNRVFNLNTYTTAFLATTTCQLSPLAKEVDNLNELTSCNCLNELQNTLKELNYDVYNDISKLDDINEARIRLGEAIKVKQEYLTNLSNAVSAALIVVNISLSITAISKINKDKEKKQTFTRELREIADKLKKVEKSTKISDQEKRELLIELQVDLKTLQGKIENYLSELKNLSNSCFTLGLQTITYAFIGSYSSLLIKGLLVGAGLITLGCSHAIQMKIEDYDKLLNDINKIYNDIAKLIKSNNKNKWDDL